MSYSLYTAVGGAVATAVTAGLAYYNRRKLTNCVGKKVKKVSDCIKSTRKSPKEVLRNIAIGDKISANTMRDIRKTFFINTIAGPSRFNQTSLYKETDLDRFCSEYVKIGVLLLKSHEIHNGDLDRAMITFRINLEKQSATYKHPDTNELVSIDLLDYSEEPEYADELKNFMDLAHEQTGFRNRQTRNYTCGSKGNGIGPKPLKKSADIKKLAVSFEGLSVNVLPKMLKNADRDKRIKIMEALLFIELYHQNLLKEVEEKITNKETKPQNESQQAQSIRMEELRYYQELQKRIEKLDAYALTVAITAEISKETVEEKVKFINSQLETDLGIEKKKKANISFGFFRGKTRQRMHKTGLLEEEYRKDVVGLLFTDRLRYQDYCDQSNVTMKQEILLDVFLREAFKFLQSKEPNQPKYQPVGFLRSQLFWGMSNTKAIGDMLTNVSEKVVNKLEVEPHPTAFNVGDKMRKEGKPLKLPKTELQNLYKHQEEKLANDIAAYRKAVFARLNPAQPGPQENEPLSNNNL